MMRIQDLLPDLVDVPTAEQRLLGALSVLLPDETRGRRHYPTDPIDFMHAVLGIDPWSVQEQITRSVWVNRYTSVASCHSMGKSMISAAIAITFLHLHESSLVLSTAPTGRQVEHILWRNIRTMYRKAKEPLLGGPPLTTRYDIAEDWYAIGFKPSDQETDPAQGFHAENVLVIIDESAGVPKILIDGMMAALTSEGARLLMIGNPTSTSGPFYDSHHANADMFERMTVSWPMTPNYGKPRPVIKGLITQMWVNDVIAKYGIDSAYYRSRVMAEWVSAEDVLIPLSQIEAAQARQIEEVPDESRCTAGLDVGRGGADESVMTIRRGAQVLGSWKVEGVEAWQTVGSAAEIIRREAPDISHLNIDEIGVGSAVVDVYKHVVVSQDLGYRIVPVNFSKTAHDPEKYKNQRCEAYGVTAERFRTGAICGQIESGVIADLSEIRYKYDGRHTQAVIELKEDFRARVGRSPDWGDSFVLAFYTPPNEEEVPMGALAFGYADTRWGRL